jgi:dephospho-CoA kinase
VPDRRPLAVAVTGGIGAGKSEVLKAFARQGVPTLSSDDVVHRLLREDDAVRRAVLERFGDRVLDDGAQLDRAAIAEIVFADREALAWLEGLLHPLVVREYLAWGEQLAGLPDPPTLSATEVPLLYEVGGDDRFDAVVVVTAPQPVREARARALAGDRSWRLLPDEEKAKRADFVYVNDGSIGDLERFVSGVIGKLNRSA